MATLDYVTPAEWMVYSGLWAVFMLAVIAHELTHFVVARLLGGDTRFKMPLLSGDMHVDYRLPKGAPQYHVLLINLSPFLIGTVTALAYYATAGFSLSGLTNRLVAVAWIGYSGMTLLSSYDLLLEQPEADTWWSNIEVRWKVLLAGMLVYVPGHYLRAVGDPYIGATRFEQFAAAIGPELSDAGVAVAVLGVLWFEFKDTISNRYEETWCYKLGQWHERQMAHMENRRDES